MSKELKYSESIYLNYNPFDGDKDDTYISAYTRKMVKTRKLHDCMLADLVGNKFHKIQIGKYAIREHAIIDGEWMSCYACIDCMDKWIDEDITK